MGNCKFVGSIDRQGQPPLMEERGTGVLMMGNKLSSKKPQNLRSVEMLSSISLRSFLMCGLEEERQELDYFKPGSPKGPNPLVRPLHWYSRR